MPDQFLESLTYESREKGWKELVADPRQDILVVENNAGEIVGFVSGAIQEDKRTGELKAIYLLKKEHGKGIGRQLVRLLFSRLKAKGCETIYVEVLAENDACRFYEKLNAKWHATTSIAIAGKLLRLYVYKWEGVDLEI
ncbi:GNAT family N-acetyltransferase [Shouchella clausii]|uniref:GNAT family N-acetyltransferase n=1 Tax=Shouchella clausii TaxID=79880 RepID=UPI00280B44BA|nr:GNAT family N-acetyltransferase [Shouchella clausii]WMM34403.1 GNAT family N-acetyltransferase [Shouchella clausii]